jgi:glycosyltransferase involved in cell wall biosynthesis
MKILLVWPYFYPENTAAAVRGNAFAKYLKQKDVEIEVIAPLKHDLSIEKQYLYNEKQSHIKVYRIPLVINANDILITPFSLLKLKRLVEEINPDTILSSSTPATITWQTAILAKKFKIPFIMDVRDPYASSLMSVQYKPVLHKIAYYVEKKSLKQARIIFAVSSRLKDLLVKQYGIEEHKIKVVTNGFDFEKINRSRKDPTTDIVFIGSLTDLGRNTTDLIKLFKELATNFPSIKFKIVGCKNIDEMQDLLETNQLKDRVQLKKPINHDEIPDQLIDSKLGLIMINKNPSFEYQIPAKTYEYLSVGLPIIALGPKNGALREFIEDNKLGFYSDDELDLAKHAVEILKDKDLWNLYHKNNLEVAKKYDRQHISLEAFEKHIKNLKIN